MTDTQIEEMLSGVGPEYRTAPPRPFERIPIDLTRPRAPVTILDAFGLYEGRMTVLAGEPEAGKSWVALWLAIRTMEQGYAVIYLDEEGGDDVIHERLLAMGADPDMVAELFWYYAFESRAWTNEDLEALDGMLRLMEDGGYDARLAVLDSLPDFLAAAGKSEDSAPDVTAFVNTVLARFRDRGIAQLVLDHLVKPDTKSDSPKRSRYARGSGSKLAKTGVGLLLEVVTAFDHKTSGLLHLWRTKDRHGRLVDVPRINRPALPLVINVGDGKVDIVPGTPRQEVEIEFDPLAERKAQILTLLATADVIELSTNKIKSTVGGRHEMTTEALAELEAEKKILSRPGANRAFYWRLLLSVADVDNATDSDF